jgi:hypothetical protein
MAEISNFEFFGSIQYMIRNSANVTTQCLTLTRLRWLRNVA